ncbi:DNA-processing protein DprA [Halobaculum rubrum]|uniref:DNA-processing protein DprA n=1 Tax=Halobaculum rubrum TaxID=2872158 RepID=UPI001CA3DB02|nr:DNA-processing protein DprA [Halobaculum rubrum]QZX99805.1 DNA-processing protein DprA [Halobaculum rubrum]QZX99842.1 DNA-processing protein DprA [Halobaculum rubrum]
MEQPDLSRDSHVVLLLASHLGGEPDGEGSDSGLGPAGWQDFATNVADSSLDSPGSLLELEPDEWPTDIWTNQANREWVTQRLGRSTRLAMSLEDLNNRGIWVTTVYEPSYPSRLAENLGRKVPPFLYVAGEEEHLSTTAVGFVGSRDADETDRGHTRRLVEKVSDDGFGIVSGGAKGIDETSEKTGLEYGGPVIEFPAEGIHHCLQDGTIRDAVMEGQMTLASHYHPRASWNVGAAMGRNKLIHGFGKYTVVVRSGDETGGTWEGSIENLKHGWSPLLVCKDDDTPPGNEALIKEGGIPIDPTTIPKEESLDEWISAQRQNVSDSVGHDDRPTRSVDEINLPNDTQSSLNDFE